MSTTTNFFEGLELHVPVKPQEIFFRLYYDDAGELICYSMEDLPEKYIEISAEQFAQSDRHIYIKDAKIHKKRLVSIGKLVPTSDPTGTDITDVRSNVQWEMKTYE